MQVSLAKPPPPIRKRIDFRSIANAGDVSVPVDASPPKKELTSPLPSNPSTAICPGSVPRPAPDRRPCPRLSSPVAVAFEVGDDDIRRLRDGRAGSIVVIAKTLIMRMRYFMNRKVSLSRSMNRSVQSERRRSRQFLTPW